MRERRRTSSIICGMVLVLAVPIVKAQTRFETQVKTVTVVDANGVAVPDARAYDGECLAWDSQAQRVRPTSEEPWRRTDAEGTFSFEFVRQGNGRSYFITDASFEQMACLYIARKDPNAAHTVQLQKPAHIQGIIRSRELPLSSVHLRLDHLIERRGAWSLLSAGYRLEPPSHEMTIDLLCPAGCTLSLNIEPEGADLRRYRRDQEIGPLAPDQTVDLGVIELQPVSGFKGHGKPAAALQVAEWVKGEPVTLDELKGKVVLLDFWGLWCGPCRKAMTKLTELHEKYAQDGLVIIAIHDASLSKEALLDPNQTSLDLSDIPFRVAIDTAPPTAGKPELFGQGATIDAYGITNFPTFILIDRDGQVATQANDEQLHLLLYGRPLVKPTTWFGRMQATHHALFVKIGVTIVLLLVLGVILGALWLRRSSISMRRP